MAENETPLPDPKALSNEKEKLPKADKYIIGFYVILCIFSVVELYSASSREVTASNIFGPLLRHSMMLFVGIIICILMSRIKLETIVRWTPTFTVLSIVAMVYVLINGDIINGARRSFSLPGFTVQPSELLKISAVLITAYIMSKNQEPGGVATKGVTWCAAIVLAFGGLLFTQGLTNTLLLMAISISMMLIGGVQWKKLGVLILVYAVIGGGALAFKMMKGDSGADHDAIMTTGMNAAGEKETIDRGNIWQKRFSRFLSDSVKKWDQPITAENRQELFAYMAQANGHVIGVLPGNSRETARLPLAFSDYIFSIVVEDVGFIGGFFLLLVYLSLLARAGTIAARCDRAFPSMVVLGMAVMIVFQALFHMAINTGVFPVSGQPLPMISRGGTSMIVTSMAFGIMLSISRYATMAGRRKAKRTLEDGPRELEALNPTQLKE